VLGLTRKVRNEPRMGEKEKRLEFLDQFLSMEIFCKRRKKAHKISVLESPIVFFTFGDELILVRS